MQLGRISRERFLPLPALTVLGALLLACASDDEGAMAEPDEPPDEQPDDEPDTGVPPLEDASRTVSFARDLRPIFTTRCAMCHVTGSPVVPYFDDPFDPDTGFIRFTNTWFEGHDTPFEVVIEPGEPDESFLVYKVEADPDPDSFDVANNGAPMPLQLPHLTDDELAAVRQWINDGANDDVFFQENVATIFGTEHRLGRRGGKCTYCHYEGSPTGLSVIDPFDPETGLVSVESLFSDKLRVAPGEPDKSFLIEKLEEDSPSGGARMPLQPARLTEAEVSLLRDWIADGALDN